MIDYLIVFSFIACISIAVPTILIALKHRSAKVADEKVAGTVSGTIFSLFGSIYAFFIGFCIVTLWSTFNTSKENVAEEANSLLVANYISRNFNDSSGFRSAIAAYMESVTHDEWLSMDKDKAMSDKTKQCFDRIWDAFRALKPGDKEDNSIYAELGTTLMLSSKLRAARALSLSGNLYPPVWIIMLIGFLGICVELHANGAKRNMKKFFVESIVVFTILSCMYFIFDINTPFSGSVNISPQAFVSALERIEESAPLAGAK
ncbi:bestrophin-like domain [Desulfolutivibrio sp.]|uniref:bestrophin-like domain n=1 Tax=Desulfolutivibrio sp. TaxID=2773296 RepID=UPI002F9657E2